MTKGLRRPRSLLNVHALPGFGGIAQLVERLVRKYSGPKSAIGTGREWEGFSL